MKQTIRLNESELRMMIDEAVNEAMMDEGLWNQLKQGTMAAFGKGDMGAKNQTNQKVRSGNAGWNFKERANAFKQNFQSQGVLDNNNDIINMLKQLMKKYGLNVKNTIGELWGQLDYEKAKVTKAGSKAQNAIYK